MTLKRLVFPILLLLAGSSAFAQFVTAEEFFERLSTAYGGINDYQARITITSSQQEGTMTGDLAFKRPNLMKLVFTEPEEQAFAIDGEYLYIYIPQLQVLLSQVLLEETEDTSNAVNLNTEAGLALMKQGYSISYAETYRTVPLEAEGSTEQVYKLRLERRRSDEQFRVLELAVTEDLFIRRISGTTVGYETVQLDFTEVRTNQGISDGFFTYDIPKEAYERKNFIYDPTQE